MTEQEIIDFLKDNKKLGICFLYMPEEVRNWCENHMKDVVKLDSNFPAKNTSPFKHKWQYLASYEEFKCNDIIALEDQYEFKSENEKGEWIEFELKDGMFYEVQRGVFYSWYEWAKFMSDNPSFTHFGGYYYGIEPIPRWYMCECVAPTDCNGSIYTSYTDGDKNIKPLTPKKIRFWRKFDE